MTLQAVFVVSVNLQGLFIFCFHCVRNTTVRSEWKAVFSRITTYVTYTAAAIDTGTRTTTDRSTSDSGYSFQNNGDAQFKKDETKF